MIHKSSWKAAQASGKLALEYFTLSAVFIGSAFFLFYESTGQSCFQKIVATPVVTDNIPLQIALGLMIIGVMIQSAQWPFHAWFLSSLNAPTPASALMHAGLINGGGFLLARFSPLYQTQTWFLISLFCIGIISVILGSFWKLIQNDLKRMLACSTMAQIGFMLVQCGLGLFPAAVAHLFWHGLFKGYLFLNLGNTTWEKRLVSLSSPNKFSFITSLSVGFWGTFVFTMTSGKNWMAFDTHFILIGLSFIALTQLALATFSYVSWKNLFSSVVLATMAALIYGGSIRIIFGFLKPLKLEAPQPLNLLYLEGFLLLFLMWLGILFRFSWAQSEGCQNFLKRFYVKALNASQPCSQTVTSFHNSYQYR